MKLACKGDVFSSGVLNLCCQVNRPRIGRIRRILTDQIRANPSDPPNPWSIEPISNSTNTPLRHDLFSRVVRGWNILTPVASTSSGVRICCPNGSSMNTPACLSVVFCVAIGFPSSPSRTPDQADQARATRSRARSTNTAKTAGGSARLVRSLERIGSRADFDRLARVYYRGRFYALPHLMFVIDRRSHDRVYYVNSNAYKFHKDFVNATYLSLERGRLFYENNYLSANRRFILGTIAFQTASGKFTFEFWEGDRLNEELLAECYAALAPSFFAPLFFKPNSLAQEGLSNQVTPEKKAAAAIPVLTASELAANEQYQPLNLGSGIGQLRYPRPRHV